MRAVSMADADGEAILELHKQHVTGQSNYTYFLLAAAASAIAFAVNQTQNASPNWRLAFVGGATLCWGFSFFFGCRALVWTQVCIAANSTLLRLEAGSNEGDHNLANPPLRAAAMAGTRKALDKNIRRAVFHDAWQFRSLILGALLFIAWRVAEIFTYRPPPPLQHLIRFKIGG
jgi:hypothetical protein